MAHRNGISQIHLLSTGFRNCGHIYEDSRGLHGWRPSKAIDARHPCNPCNPRLLIVSHRYPSCAVLLSGRPTEHTSAKEVEVEVVDRLARASIHIEYRAVALLMDVRLHR